MAQKKRKKPGPKPHRLKIEGDWQEAIAKALKVDPSKVRKQK